MIGADASPATHHARPDRPHVEETVSPFDGPPMPALPFRAPDVPPPPEPFSLVPPPPPRTPSLRRSLALHTVVLALLAHNLLFLSYLLSRWSR